MAEPISIPINVTKGNLSGLDDLERRLTQLQHKFAGVQQAYSHIGQQISLLGSTPGALSLSQLGFQRTASGIARIGYTGGLPPPVPPLPTPMGYTYVRPGGVRPLPAGLTAAPFGTVAGVQPGVPPSARPGSPAWLAAQGYTVVPPGTPPGQMPSAAGPLTPLQQASAQMPPVLGPPTALQHAHALLLSQQQNAYQQGLQRAQLIALMAQLGPQPSQGTGVGSVVGGAVVGAVTGGGGLPGMIGGALGGAVGGVPGMIIGATIGKGISRGIDMALQGLETRREREVSILRLGDTLNQQFGTLRETLGTLRRDFQVLGQEGVQAMTSLARATGLEEGALTRATLRAVGAGRYYGMTATESVGLLTSLHMAGAPMPDLTAVMAVGHEAAARHPGTISVPRFASEVTRTALAGGLGFAPMTETDYARQTQFMQEMGGRYATHPGLAFEQRAEAMGRPQSTIGQVLQVSALDQLRRTQRYVWLGKGPSAMRLDLHDPEDMQIAMENIAQIPEARESLRQEIVRHSPGNTTLQRVYYGQATGLEHNAYQRRLEWEGTQRIAGEFGSIPGYMNRPADIEVQRAREAARRAAEVGQPGLTELQRRMVPEELSETAPMRALEEARSRVQIAFGAVAESFNKGLAPTEAFFQAMDRLAPLLQGLATSLGVTPAGAGGFGTPPALGGVSGVLLDLMMPGMRQLGDVVSSLTMPAHGSPQGPRKPQP